MKNIIKSILLFFVLINSTNALNIDLGAISDPSHLLPKMGTETGSGTYETIYRQDGGYIIRQGGNTYSHIGTNLGNLQPYTPPTYNNNVTFKIETQRFLYSMIPFAGGAQVNIYDKVNNSFHNQQLDWSFSSTIYRMPKWFFLEGKLYYTTQNDGEIYYNYFDHDPTDTSILGSFELTQFPDAQQIQYMQRTVTESGASRLDFAGSDTGSSLYTVMENGLYLIQFVNDATLGIVRGEGLNYFENNTFDFFMEGGLNTRISPYYSHGGVGYYQFYKVLLIGGEVFISLGRFSSSAYNDPWDETNLDIETIKYDLVTQTWSYVDDAFMLSYNHFIGKGYTLSKTFFIDHNVKIRFPHGPLVLIYYDVVNEYLRKSWVNKASNFWTSTESIPEDYIDGDPEDPGEDPNDPNDPNDPGDDGTSIFGSLTNPLTTFFGGVNDSYDEVTGGKGSLEDGTKDLINNFDGFETGTTSTGTTWNDAPTIDPQLQNIVNGFDKMDTGKDDFLSSSYYILKIFILLLFLIGLISFLIFKYSD